MILNQILSRTHTHIFGAYVKEHPDMAIAQHIAPRASSVVFRHLYGTMGLKKLAELILEAHRVLCRHPPLEKARAV